MLEIEKKRANEIDSKMNVNINLVTGQVDLKINEEDSAFEFGAQTRDVNNFLQDQFSGQSRQGYSFKPFEGDSTCDKLILDPES